MATTADIRFKRVQGEYRTLQDAQDRAIASNWSKQMKQEIVIHRCAEAFLP